MQKVISLWSNLDTRRRIIVALATIAVFATVLGLSRMAAKPGMALLYAGLDSAQAGEVIAALDAQGALYEVRGSAIFVEEAKRDVLRMTLASDGLPANSGAGYELLDNLSGFGTTSQMFDAAYWRAKEGELARTIVANPAIRSARVHIANSGMTPFRKTQSPTASVSITTRGEELSDAGAKAIRFLVGSAVAGLSSDDVAIIDATTGRMLGPDGDLASQSSGDDRAALLKANVQRLLEAHVGPGNVVVEVSVETITDAESIHERRFDPQSRVAISTDVEEVVSSDQNGGGKGVTVASNLPDGDAASQQDSSQSQNSENRERTNYEVSETTREVTRVPGAIKRLSVAVLLNTASAPGGAGNGQTPSETELGALHDLVASAVGFDQSRGDVITLKALDFGPVPLSGTVAISGFLDRLLLEPMRLVQLGVLGVVCLALGLFVVRPILAGSARRPDFDALVPVTGGLPTAAERALAGGSGLLEGSALSIDPTAEGVRAGQGPGGTDITGTLAALPGTGAPTTAALSDDPLTHLKQLIEDRQSDTVEILRSWLEDDTLEETA